MDKDEAQPAPVPDWKDGVMEQQAKTIVWQAKRIAELLDQQAAQPSPVQQCMEHGECFGGECIYTTPPAQPAVPDAFGTREGEHPQYIQGWNDCRAETLKMRKP
jgi:hypothetical protein